MKIFFLFLTTILEGFSVQKMKIWKEIERGRGDFYHPSNEGLDPFFLPFTEGSCSLNSGNQALGGEWGWGMSPRTHLLKPLERFCSISIWTSLLVGKDGNMAPLSSLVKFLTLVIVIFFLAAFGITLVLPPLDFCLFNLVVPNLTYLRTSALLSRFWFG